MSDETLAERVVAWAQQRRAVLNGWREAYAKPGYEPARMYLSAAAKAGRINDLMLAAANGGVLPEVLWTAITPDVGLLDEVLCSAVDCDVLGDVLRVAADDTELLESVLAEAKRVGLVKSIERLIKGGNDAEE